jgi:hypothetical protein
MESADQVASVLLITIRLDKTQSRTLSSSLLYVLLRFADKEKSPTLGEVHMQYTNTKHTYRYIFCFVDKYLFVILVFSLMYLISFVQTHHYHYDRLEQYHDPSNMPEYYHYDSS